MPIVMILRFISCIASHSYLKFPKATALGISIRENLKGVHNAPDYKKGANDGGDVTASKCRSFFNGPHVMFLKNAGTSLFPIDRDHRNIFITQQPAPVYPTSRQIKIDRASIKTQDSRPSSRQELMTDCWRDSMGMQLFPLTVG